MQKANVIPWVMGSNVVLSVSASSSGRQTIKAVSRKFSSKAIVLLCHSEAKLEKALLYAKNLTIFLTYKEPQKQTKNR